MKLNLFFFINCWSMFVFLMIKCATSIITWILEQFEYYVSKYPVLPTTHFNVSCRMPTCQPQFTWTIKTNVKKGSFISTIFFLKMFYISLDIDCFNWSMRNAGLLATDKENLFRVSPLRRVEPILLWRGRTFSENPRPYIFCLWVLLGKPAPQQLYL